MVKQSPRLYVFLLNWDGNDDLQVKICKVSCDQCLLVFSGASTCVPGTFNGNLNFLSPPLTSTLTSVLKHLLSAACAEPLTEQRPAGFEPRPVTGRGGNWNWLHLIPDVSCSDQSRDGFWILTLLVKRQQQRKQGFVEQQVFERLWSLNWDSWL